jgi:outer membrane protein, multidrug efflux system
VSRRLPAAAAALFLPVACAVGPDYERPALPVTPTYRDWPAQMESIADLPWWQVFRDAVLERLIREALDNNRDLLAAAERVERARYLAGVQRGELFPIPVPVSGDRYHPTPRDMG